MDAKSLGFMINKLSRDQEELEKIRKLNKARFDKETYTVTSNLLNLYKMCSDCGQTGDEDFIKSKEKFKKVSRVVKLHAYFDRKDMDRLGIPYMIGFGVFIQVPGYLLDREISDKIEKELKKGKYSRIDLFDKKYLPDDCRLETFLRIKPELGIVLRDPDDQECSGRCNSEDLTNWYKERIKSYNNYEYLDIL